MNKAQILAFADASITLEQVESLSDEAGQAGDLEMVAICGRAIAGDESAVRQCEQVIADTEGQDDTAARDWDRGAPAARRDR